MRIPIFRMVSFATAAHRVLLLTLLLCEVARAKRAVKAKTSKLLLPGNWPPVDVSWGEDAYSVCSSGSEKCCSQRWLHKKAFPCSKVGASEPLSNSWLDMPEQLQGVFWLQRLDHSAIVSFGRTADGCGISTGKLTAEGKYFIRVSGDRSWSFQDEGLAFKAAQVADVVYEYIFDDATDPQSARVVPKTRRVLGASFPAWLLSFSLTLMTAGSTEYQDSVVWKHTAAVLAVGFSHSDFYWIQVIDGSGKKLPAFHKWMDNCHDPHTVGARSPGLHWHHSFDGAHFKTLTLEEEYGECPSVLNRYMPKIVDKALFLGDAFGFRDFAFKPKLDEAVLDDFTFMATVGLVARNLASFYGAHLPPSKRMCAPTKTQTVTKTRLFGHLSPNIDIDPDPFGENGCKGGFQDPASPIMLCFFLTMRELPLLDGVVSNTWDTGNTWETALGTQETRGMSKEQYIMHNFGHYKTKDGDDVYPVREIDFTGLYRDDSGGWRDLLESRLALDIVGSHRVEAARDDERLKCGGETIALVLRTDFFDSLKRRPGFAPWGADMFFSGDGLPLMIRTPRGKQIWKDGAPSEWQYWKWVFRSSMFNLVTLVDHLWFSHLTLANVVATIARDEIDYNHPLRRFLSMISFGTVQVNTDALHQLLGPHQLLHRSSPFEDWGEVHQGGKGNMYTWRKYFEPVMNATALGELPKRVRVAPYYQDGAVLYTAISELVDDMFATYRDQWCRTDSGEIADQEVKDYVIFTERWMMTERSKNAPANLEWVQEGAGKWTCPSAAKLLKTQMFGVTGWHAHVGKVGDLVRDPTLVGFSWAEGEPWARPRQAVQYALVSAVTSKRMPRLNENYDHMFAGVDREKEMKGVLRRFRQRLDGIDKTIAHRNTEREHPYGQMAPSYVAISLSV